MDQAVRPDSAPHSHSKDAATAFAAESSASSMRVDRLLWGYAFTLSLVTLIAWIAYWISPTAVTFPLFDPADRFHDLLNYIPKFAHLDQGPAALAQGLPVFNYPAPAVFVYKLLLLSPAHSIRPYLILLAVSIGAFAALAWRAAGLRLWRNSGAAAAVIVTVLFGSPLWFTADRCNIEGVVWIFATIGLCFFLSGRYLPCAVALAIAGAIKPFPALFVLLLVANRRFKEAAVAALLAFTLVVAALAALGPTPLKAYQALLPGVDRYLNSYVNRYVSPIETRFNHSLLDGMKTALLVYESHTLAPDKLAADQTIHYLSPAPDIRAERMVRFYPAVAAGLLLLIGFVFYSKPVLNQLIAVAVAVALLPLSAAEYTLLYLYVPFAAFVIFLVRDVAPGRVVFSRTAAALVLATSALLLAPLTMLNVLDGAVKMLLLLLLLVLAARYPMRSRFFAPHGLSAE